MIRRWVVHQKHLHRNGALAGFFSIAKIACQLVDKLTSQTIVISKLGYSALNHKQPQPLDLFS